VNAKFPVGWIPEARKGLLAEPVRLCDGAASGPHFQVLLAVGSRDRDAPKNLLGEEARWGPWQRIEVENGYSIIGKKSALNEELPTVHRGEEIPF
jgi:hypothetical protein